MHLFKTNSFEQMDYGFVVVRKKKASGSRMKYRYRASSSNHSISESSILNSLVRQYRKIGNNGLLFSQFYPKGKEERIGCTVVHGCTRRRLADTLAAYVIRHSAVSSGLSSSCIFFHVT